jgi:hypothetical protein
MRERINGSSVCLDEPLGDPVKPVQVGLHGLSEPCIPAQELDGLCVVRAVQERAAEA